MSFTFDPRSSLLIVKVEVTGPERSFVLSLALDTGATVTLINQSSLLKLGYDPAASSERYPMTTGSAVEFAPRVTLSKLYTLGQERVDFPVICHNLPPSAGIDGLLGLDFFRGQNLNIDFRAGLITLT